MNTLISKRYLLVKQIGSGGMADVFLAMDTVLNREVALKRLRGDLSHDPVALLRFQREANAASGLNHPNIVDVYDVGEDDGQHYIVMEMMRGTTLKELVHRRGALDKYEAVAIMQQLARALIKAHSNNVIHRDIKPQNILVKDDGTVKITDFGIALAGDALQLTKSDSVLGSVHYMAPECSRGEGASPQSDIYALGVVFYELLTGDVPYRGDTPVEIAMKHIRDDFPLVTSYNSSLPNSIVNIIAKASHKNKLHRYGSAQEMVEDLDTCLDESRQHEPLWSASIETDDGTKIMTSLNGVKEKVDGEDQKKKKRNWMFAGGVLAVILFIGLVVFFNRKPPEPTEFEMINVVGKSLDEALTELEEAQLKVNQNYDYRYSDEYERGIIIQTRPEVGAMVKKGESIRIVISEGKTLVIPDFSGMSEADVRSMLSAYNISYTIIREADPSVGDGLIIRQERLVEGTSINPEQRHELVLYVSTDVELVLPNDSIGRSWKDVKSELEALGVVVSTQELSMEGMSPSEIDLIKFDVVVKSDPMPGSFYIQSEGKSVTLYYYDSASKPAVEVPVTGEKPDENSSTD